jgi:hypothetical protein
MGAELRAYFKNALGEAAGVSGRAIGSDGTPDGVRVLITVQADKGIPDGIYRFNTKNVRVAEGLLTDEYIESQVLDSSDLPGDIDLDNLPSIDTLERVDITPDDLRLATDGINSPEGQEMSAFKESPEGAITSTIDGKTSTIKQRESGNYVLSNLESLGLNKNYFSIQSESTSAGKYKFMLNANYSHLATYKWELGNGVVKTDKNVVYYYKSPGKFKVKLTVNDICGQRVYTRTVKYQAPPKPVSKKKSKPSKSADVKRKN